MRRVIVVGSINVDLVIHIPRLPNPGETVSGGSHSIYQGGKGANQAVALARLGSDVALIGAIGKDDFGFQAKKELFNEGVQLTCIEKDLPTGVAQIMVGSNGENLIAVAPGANNALEPEDIITAFESQLTDGAIVLANLEVPYQTVLTAVGVARKRGCTFILNPAPAQLLSSDLLKNCDILTPNEHEAIALGFENITDTFQYGVKAVVVTKGAQGADLLRPHSPVHHLDAFPIDVIDTTGAGDAFNATFAWALSRETTYNEAIRLAVIGGSLATRKLGAREAMASQAELLEYAKLT